MWFLGSVLFFVLVGSSLSQHLEIITAKPGEDIILPCEDTNIKQDRVFKWVRTDQNWERNVFIYWNNSVDLEDQDESFKNRVFLKDSQMKDGDLSVVLKNVTIEDSGRYECIIINEDDPWRLGHSISIIDLSVSPPEMNITAEPGENVTLTCGDTNINGDFNLHWRRLDQEWNTYMFFNRNNCVVTDDQDESFKNRVFLKDSQMKDGDLSVVLKNVMIEDSGRYECRVEQEDNPLSLLYPISIIDLMVIRPGDKDGGGVKDEGGVKDGIKEEKGSSQGVLLGMVLSGLLLAVLVLAVGLWISENQKGSNQSSRGSNQQQNPDRDLLNSERNTTNTEPAV